MQKIIEKVGLIYIQDKRLLMAKSKDSDRYYLPGGKPESGESDKAALIREIKEELSVDVIPSSLTYLHCFYGQAHNKNQGVMVEMKCFMGKFSGVLKANAEIQTLSWFTYADKTKGSIMAQMVMDWLFKQKMIA
ncbi:NUDIX hydrolase [Facilibium subflavum]|uniref:NUDIX hydrolase n=1 Tax=Facilibium subflavum TaxID=2219058 RepID=UPI000E65AB43|nr:NUDIX domain-containing protein [Facilibium subflavum]